MKVSFSKNKFISLIIAVVMVVVDFVSKQLVLAYAPKSDSFDLIPILFKYKFVLNKGAAFGILDNARWVFMLTTIVFIVIVVLYFLFTKANSLFLLSSVMLIFSGGIGNMIDRISMGEVVDFITFGFFSFPSFNIADCCVTIGCVMLVIYLIFIEPKSNKGDNNERA